jgi:pimeloyl-ACP methyl ester carboxylesterase
MLSERTVRTAAGRTLAYAEWGDPDGIPVVFHHGTPGSRLDRHPDDAVYEGFRILAADRPGYGGSDRDAGRTVASAAGDTAALANDLGIDTFAVLGVSGGGPHALACAALLPERVTRAAIIVGAAPSDDPDFDFLAGMAEINQKEFGAALQGRDAIEAELDPWVEAAATNPEAVIDEIAAQLPEYDQEVIGRPPVRAVVRDSLAESIRQGTAGWADDDLAFATGWGFSVEDVRVPVRLWQGELDVLVPRSHGQYLARKIPGARFELVPGAGHMLLDHWPDVLGWLAA